MFTYFGIHGGNFQQYCIYSVTNDILDLYFSEYKDNIPILLFPLSENKYSHFHI